MNIKELNGVFLLAIKDFASTAGPQKAAIFFAADVKAIQNIQALDERRLREFVEKVDVPLFRIANESALFWSDLASEDAPVDWTNVSLMRSLLTLADPTATEGKH